MVSNSQMPLSVDEIIACFQRKWHVTYDIQLIVREKRLYLQIMWGYLEQQSFPMNEESYREHVNAVIEIINRLGLSAQVREWIYTTPHKPRLGRALTFYLQGDERLKEFLI